MNLTKKFFFSLLCFAAISGSAQVKPSATQLKYQRMETIGFIHFTVNTFTDKEWGDGTESPSIFNPTQLDANQWVQAAKSAGLKQLIITAKHHDGFCLWPSKYTEHSVKKSPWKNGKGDVVKELSEACRKAGLKFGIYLSPWDRHEPKYGTKDYNQYYLNQLTELLTNYGEISEIWMDGAKGENAKDMEYDFPAFRALIRKLQPNALIFSDAGPDIRWIGNESGEAGETNWSTINADNVVIGKADQKYLNRGDSNGSEWVVGESDVSIRPGWFYHASEDDKVKSPQKLVDIYYKSVGRNSVLLLNLPPDRRGLIHENDVKILKEFKRILDETFKVDFAQGRKVKFTGEALRRIFEVDLGSEKTFDRIMLQEPIEKGQSVAEFFVEALINNRWTKIAGGSTVGYKRLLEIEPVKAKAVRVIIKEMKFPTAISRIGLFKSSPREKE